MQQFGHISVMYLEPRLSDHSPIMIDLEGVKQKRGLFRVLNSVIESDGFVSAVAQSWSEISSSVGTRRVWCKLLQLKAVVTRYKCEHIGHIGNRIVQARELLQKIQIRMVNGSLIVNLYREESEAMNQLRKWFLIEEKDAQ